MTTSGRRLVDQVECRPVGELRIRLVDDDEAGRRCEQLLDPLSRLDEPGRVVRRGQEDDVRSGVGEHPVDLGRIEREVVAAFTLDDGRTRDPGDLRVHLIGRLERDDGPTRPGVREQHRLQHLVRSVRHEHLGRITPVERCDVGSQRERSTVRIPVPVRRDSSRRRARRGIRRAARTVTRSCSAGRRRRPGRSGIPPARGGRHERGSRRLMLPMVSPTGVGRFGRYRRGHGRIDGVHRTRTGDDRRQHRAVPGTGRRARRSPSSAPTETTSSSAIHEAERQIRIAERGLHRAVKTAG